MKESIILIILIALFNSCNNNPTKSEVYEMVFKDDFVFVEPKVIGNTFYIDPQIGSPNGDGSINNPWRTLQEVIDSGLIQCYKYSENYNSNSPLILKNENGIVKGGDKLILRDGYHGFLTYSEMIFKEWPTIEAYDNEEPIFSRINFTGAFEKIYLKNLTINKSSFVGDESYWIADEINYNTSSCLYLGSSNFWGPCREIKINGLEIKTTDNVTLWNANTWVERAASGISLRSAKKVDVVNCNIKNIQMGISIDYNSDSSNVAHNNISNYSGDGARLCSNDCFFGYNKISNCYDVDENHDDGIQSFSRGADGSSGSGVLKNNVVRSNLIIGVTDFNNVLAGNPQGIGCFDGLFENWIVENNVIITNHYHGISFYGFINSQILNNTVVDQVFDDGMAPWIRINNHKNGTKSNNCIVANNIAASSISTEGDDIITCNNFIIGSDNHGLYEYLFDDYNLYNLSLINNDTTRLYLIDHGKTYDAAFSSIRDHLLNIRDSIPDIGAYEWN